ncbi:hypothetical protein [Pontibacter liquoris]|uniref:hypothetical protein n=1 Tax=Pontibacter liquoris TaxID=2905677 RepID=UPI001FA6CE95|nr:hypothetical protein [Pontibacter liquoris]
MPRLITRNTTETKEQPCHFTDLSQNVFLEEQVTIEALQARCARYRDLLASLQPPQENTMIRAANFTTDSVLQLIQQSPTSAFIRVYYGLDENGEHLLFMAPVSDAGTLAMTEETIYVDDCCRCPPMGNCPEDPLLAS